MERITTVFMMNLLKKNRIFYYFIILFLIITFHQPFINILANINTFTKEKDDYLVAENNLLKTENKALKEDINSLSDLGQYAKYNYSLTRLSYRELYNNSTIYILGGEDKNYNVGNALINSLGLVGIITEVKKNYSKVRILPDLKDFSVKINNSYGSISSFKDGLLLVMNISNYDDIHLNDEVYTSSLGNIHESLYIGYVYKIEEHNINKDIYIKTKVDFNNLNYMYVVGE